MTLPEGWAETTLGEICWRVVDGSHNPPPEASDGLPMLSARNIMYGKINFDAYRRIAPVDFADEDQRTQIVAGSVLVTIVGALGRSAVVGTEHGKFTLQRSVAVLHPEAEVEPSFLAQRFDAPDSVAWFQKNARGTAQKGVYLKTLSAFCLPLPPAAEQRRIVAKLDALTARIARARTELDRVAALAVTVREKTVRKAFRGELTHPRHSQRENGSATLPDGWNWQTLGDIAEIQTGLALGKKRTSNVGLVDAPYLRVANVQRGSLNLSVIKTVPASVAEIKKLTLKSGDILLNEGGDRDKLGRGWIWEGQVPNCIHQNHVFRARLRNQQNSPFYVSLYANEFGQDFFFEHGTQTTNLASISKAKISSLPVPMAPPDEQLEIVRLIQSAFARADRLEAEVARARALLDRLESAILAKAFRGELVPQDPNDEPASVLLERIRAARAATPKQKRGRKGGMTIPDHRPKSS